MTEPLTRRVFRELERQPWQTELQLAQVLGVTPWEVRYACKSLLWRRLLQPRGRNPGREYRITPGIDMDNVILGSGMSAGSALGRKLGPKAQAGRERGPYKANNGRPIVVHGTGEPPAVPSLAQMLGAEA